MVDGNTLLAFAIFAGAGFILLGSVGLLLKAFGTHWGWGLGVLLIPFAWVAYLIKHWKDGKGMFGACLTGLGLLLIPTISGALSGQTPDTYGREVLEAFLHPDTEVEHMTSPDAEKRRLAKMKASLQEQYKTLDKNDPEAMASFSRAIEAYKQRKRVYEQKK
ncbi:MAG: hypothetical protein ACI9TH_003447 [Kiritimatiellia bacterium]|jgi:hypothetical protein